MLAAYLFICTFLAYGIKGITGFGNTLVMNGLFSLRIENRLTSPADLIISLPANLWMAWRERRHLRMRVALPLSLMLLAGILPGVFLLKVGNAALLKCVLGVVIIGMGIEMLTRQNTQKKKPPKGVLFVIGLVSGVLAGMYGIGALLAAYVSRTTDEPGAFRANLCFVFAVDNVARMILYLATGILTWQVLGFALFLAPAAGLGLALSLRFGRRIPVRAVTLVTIGMLIVSGAALVIQNIGALL
ncbi:MAG: sulfite exporter TauE/SafE family protein [Christensenellales bacterium]|jgi:uncharacterized membrane protein YfcA